ncbi:MAG TPA: class E sortase [Patescibacteria group bacterium]|nr:class E sortase [Patescibacteria group bacterium]
MKLSRINTLLVIAIIGINTYVIVLPFTPQAVFWWRSHHSTTQKDLARKLAAPAPVQPNTQDTETGDRVVIPTMLLDQPINQGKDARTLNKGLWLRPQGSTPDKGSNTVIAGHRFTYTNPRGTFYFLDKVKVGDEIAVFWSNKKYVYRVNKTMVVPPTALEVEAPTKTSQLTLYTCTPLWNPKDRLVVVATLEEQEP